MEGALQGSGSIWEILGLAALFPAQPWAGPGLRGSSSVPGRMRCSLGTLTHLSLHHWSEREQVQAARKPIHLKYIPPNHVSVKTETVHFLLLDVFGTLNPCSEGETKEAAYRAAHGRKAEGLCHSPLNGSTATSGEPTHYKVPGLPKWAQEEQSGLGGRLPILRSTCHHTLIWETLTPCFSHPRKALPSPTRKWVEEMYQINSALPALGHS